jgi:hypothetical protein
MKTRKELYNKIIKNIEKSTRKSRKSRKLYKNMNLLEMNKSYSPMVNKFLDIDKLETFKIKSVKLCDNLLQINVGTESKPICLNFNEKRVKIFLLKNLKSSKHLDPSKFIAPKQLYSNCWFNTMFVVFFFSDKGRKFFRFFRNLMITGRKFDKSRLEDQELRKLLFIFNLYIEASYNQNSVKTKKNKVNLHEQVKVLTGNLDTNFLITKIYNRIKKINSYIDLPNIDEAGNPLEFYQIIMAYMKYNILNILRVDIDSEKKKNYKNVKNILDELVLQELDIIIIEDHESKIDYDEEYIIELNNKKYKYKLDSIILTNKDHYNPKANSHFVSVLTINKEGYKFDGSSYSKLTKFNWRKILNKNIDFTFLENPAYYPEKYNFKKGYKIMFYYRS